MLKAIEGDISGLRLIEIIWRMFQDCPETIEHYKYIYSKYAEFGYSDQDFEDNFAEFKLSLIDVNENLKNGEITEDDQKIFIQVLNANNAAEKKSLVDLEHKTYIRVLEKIDREDESGQGNILENIF